MAGIRIFLGNIFKHAGLTCTEITFGPESISPLTPFERELRKRFKEHHLGGELSALVVACPFVPTLREKGWTIYGVKDGNNPWALMRELKDMGYHTAMALDMRSPLTLEEQVPEWLPGTMEFPSRLIPMPVITIPYETLGEKPRKEVSETERKSAPRHLMTVIKGGYDLP